MVLCELGVFICVLDSIARQPSVFVFVFYKRCIATSVSLRSSQGRRLGDEGTGASQRGGNRRFGLVTGLDGERGTRREEEGIESLLGEEVADDIYIQK